MDPWAEAKIRWQSRENNAQGAYPLVGEEKAPLDLPVHSGRAQLHKLQLGEGMGLGRAVYDVGEARGAEFVEHIRFAAEVNEPFLTVQYWRKRQGAYLESGPQGHTAQERVAISPGLSIFRCSWRWDATLATKAGDRAENVSLVLPLRVLKQRLGAKSTALLLQRLGLRGEQGRVSHMLPSRVTHPLEKALASPYQGDAKRLLAGARVQEFFAELVHDASAPSAGTAAQRRYRARLHQLRDYLTELDGPLPTLEALGQEFGLSARRLNELFRQEFGQSLMNYVMAQRLEAAHALLRESSLPVKALAVRCGFAHPSHFIAAFKRRYGYTPGSLRRK